MPAAPHLSSRKPLKITSNEAPMSAAMAAQREAKPRKVAHTKKALTESEKAMFWRMTRRVRRAWRISQGTFERSSAISAMSAVSIAASLPAAPMAMPRVARAMAGASLTPSPIMAAWPCVPTKHRVRVNRSFFVLHQMSAEWRGGRTYLAANASFSCFTTRLTIHLGSLVVFKALSIADRLAGGVAPTTMAPNMPRGTHEGSTCTRRRPLSRASR